MPLIVNFAYDNAIGMKIAFRILFLLVTALLAGCDKEKFPDEFNLQGPWIEKNEAAFRVEIEFRSSNRAFLKRAPETGTDTLLYRLDKADELLLFKPEDFPDGNRTTHKMTYNRKSEELTINGLLPSVGGTPSSTIFIRK